MGGDYSRFTHKPRNSYSEVRKQQGRVGLDSDWNEAAAIQDRRWRSETIDIMGRCVVPESTPDAFSIQPTGSGHSLSFTIGPGRMYLDGLQIECFGGDPDQFDPALAEESGLEPVAADKQPFMPIPHGSYPVGPNPVLIDKQGKLDLIYVEAWQREVTAREDSDLREVALGGADTATRLQTVWQVKRLPLGEAGNSEGLHCGGDVPGWDTLTQPSGARLTVEAIGAPEVTDPCVLPPFGGYRGLENRLYRVEIHSHYATDGATTVKWDRDNASLTAAIDPQSAAQGGTNLTLAELGPHGISQFEAGDWIEILDDTYELGTAVDQPRERLAIIASVHPERQQLELDRPVLGLRCGHPRLRRWKGVVDLTFPSQDSLTLDGCIGVKLSGAAFRPGDYWVFAARTANGSVESLNEAPPRGINRHYAQLALITWGEDAETTSVISCRTLWPRQSCCEITVRPGEDIQAAIDRVADTGGCVCLLTGDHELAAPLSFFGRQNVTLKGVGSASSLRAAFTAPNGADGLLRIDQSQDIRLHDFAIIGNGRDLIAVANSMSIRLERLALLCSAPDDDCCCVNIENGVDGIIVRDTTLAGANSVCQNQTADGSDEPLRNLEVVGCSVSAFQAGIRLHDAVGVTVTANMFQASNLDGACAFSANLLEDARIADNQFHCDRAIRAEYSRSVSVYRNRFNVADWAISSTVVLLWRIEENDIRLTGVDAERARPETITDYFEQRHTAGRLAIQVGHAWDLIVSDNRVEAPSFIGPRRDEKIGIHRPPKASILRILRLQNWWPVAVELGWVALSHIADRFAEIGRWKTEREIDSAARLEEWLFENLLSVATETEVPSFLGRITVSRNQSVVERFGILFDQILTIGSIRIVDNRVSGFRDAGVLIHPWRSLSSADVLAYWARCAMLWLRAQLTTVLGRQAAEEPTLWVPQFARMWEPGWQGDTISTGAHSSTAGELLASRTPGYQASHSEASTSPPGDFSSWDLDWIGEMWRFCMNLSEGNEEFEILRPKVEYILSEWDSGRLDDLTNHDYVIEGNALIGSGDGAWLAIDGGQIRNNRIEIHPDTWETYSAVALGRCALTAGAAHVNPVAVASDNLSDVPCDESAILFLHALACGDRERVTVFGRVIANAIRSEDAPDYVARLRKCLRVLQPCAQSNSEIREFLTSIIADADDLIEGDTGFEALAQRWEEFVVIVVTSLKGYGIVMLGNNMGCAGNRVTGSRSCLHQWSAPASAPTYGSPFPAIAGIWQWWDYPGWLATGGQDITKSEEAPWSLAQWIQGAFMRGSMRLWAWSIGRPSTLDIDSNHVDSALLHGIYTISDWRGEIAGGGEAAEPLHGGSANMMGASGSATPQDNVRIHNNFVRDATCDALHHTGDQRETLQLLGNTLERTPAVFKQMKFSGKRSLVRVEGPVTGPKSVSARGIYGVSSGLSDAEYAVDINADTVAFIGNHIDAQSWSIRIQASNGLFSGNIYRGELDIGSNLKFPDSTNLQLDKI